MGTQLRDVTAERDALRAEVNRLRDRPTVRESDPVDADELERLARAAYAEYWGMSEPDTTRKWAILPRDEKVRFRDMASAIIRDYEPGGHHYQLVVAERDSYRTHYELACRAIGLSEFSSKPLAAAILELVADRDALAASEQCANDAHHRAELHLMAIYAALWPDLPHEWAPGEATAAGFEILNGVAKLTAERDALRATVAELSAAGSRAVKSLVECEAERDALRRAVDWLWRNDGGAEVPGWLLKIVNATPGAATGDGGAGTEGTR
jgi:hypothetical protein